MKKPWQLGSPPLSGQELRPASDKYSGPPRRCLSDQEIDRWLAEEVVPSGAAERARHLQDCGRCQQRLHELRAFRTHARQVLPTLHRAAMERKVAADHGAMERRAAADRGAIEPQVAASERELAATRTHESVGGAERARSARSAALAAAAALLLVITGGVIASRSGGEPENEGTRSKGGIRIGFFVKRGEAVSEGGPAHVLHPGDAVQFAVRASGAGYVSILSLDGAGQISVYYPEGDMAAAFSRYDRILPRSTVLDDVLGPETFLAVHCERPVALAILKARFRDMGAERFSVDGCTSDFLRVEKRRP